MYVLLFGGVWLVIAMMAVALAGNRQKLTLWSLVLIGSMAAWLIYWATWTTMYDMLSYFMRGPAVTISVVSAVLVLVAKWVRVLGDS